MNHQSRLRTATALALLLWALPAAADTATVKSCSDDVTFDAIPERPVVNDASMTQTIIDLGLIDRFVGVGGIGGLEDTIVAAPEVLAAVKAKKFSEQYPTLEAILGQDPDFYYAGWQYGFSEETGVTPAGLAALGIKTYVLYESCIRIGSRPPISMETIYADILALGVIFRIEERAAAMVEDFRQRVDAVSAKLADVERRPRVLYCTASCNNDSPPWVAGAEAMPRLLIELAGGENLFNDIPDSYVRASWEDVISRDPEWIVITPYMTPIEEIIGYLTTSPNLANVSAIRNHNFVVLESPFAEPSTRNVEALERLARAMFPERFPEGAE